LPAILIRNRRGRKEEGKRLKERGLFETSKRTEEEDKRTRKESKRKKKELSHLHLKQHIMHGAYMFHGTRNDGSAFVAYKSHEYWMAAEANNSSKVAALLADERVDANYSPRGGQTTLMGAARKGYDSVVAELLEWEKLEVNATNGDGHTALIFAAAVGCESVVAKLVQCERVDVNIENVDKATALFIAAFQGHGSIVAKLIESAAIHLDIVSVQEISPVMIAASNGHDSIVDMLANAGAVLSKTDTSQFSLHSIVPKSDVSPEKKAAMSAVLKKHGIISDNVSSNFQSKYYFQDGEGKFYLRNLQQQRWLNRRMLFLAIYRIYQWSVANQVEDEARRTLSPDLSDLGRFICQCWFDVAGAANMKMRLQIRSVME
jgi:hypothetical protein